MIIYNVTIKVEASIAKEWLTWLLRDYIPTVMATNCFIDYRVVKLLDIDETEGPTYAIQYEVANMEDYNHYIKEFAPDFFRQSVAKWQQQFISFSTIMEVVK